MIRCEHDDADVRLNRNGQDFEVCISCHARIVRLQRAAHCYLPTRTGRAPEARMHDYRSGHTFMMTERQALSYRIWSSRRQENLRIPKEMKRTNWPHPKRAVTCVTRVL